MVIILIMMVLLSSINSCFSMENNKRSLSLNSKKPITQHLQNPGCEDVTRPLPCKRRWFLTPEESEQVKKINDQCEKRRDEIRNNPDKLRRFLQNNWPDYEPLPQLYLSLPTLFLGLMFSACSYFMYDIYGVKSAPFIFCAVPSVVFNTHCVFCGPTGFYDWFWHDYLGRSL